MIRTLLLRASVAVLILGAWEIAPRAGLADPTFLPPFSSVVDALWNWIASGEIVRHVSISLQRTALGLGLSILIGVPLGILIGTSHLFAGAFDGPLQASRQVSAIALFPVFILFFGIGELSKVMIIFWASVWPILLNATAGVTDVDPVLIRSARSMGARGLVLFRKVTLPAATPAIFTGIRTGAAYAFMVLVAAEMIGANAGLGFLVLHSQEVFRIPQMYAAIVALAIFGLVLNKLLLVLEHNLTSWRAAATGH
ncbi:ABC transporter permease [Pseudothauera nasutitermitis]|nr:ABC transporter permease [Pseudothauera nasutitermitis]